MPEQENTQKGDLLRVTVADGKYTVVQSAKGELYALRYNKIWHGCVADNLILALAYEVDKLRAPKLYGVQHVSDGRSHIPHLCRTEEARYRWTSEELVRQKFGRLPDETAQEHVEAFQRCHDIHRDCEDDTATPATHQRYAETEFNFDIDVFLFWDFDTAEIEA